MNTKMNPNAIAFWLFATSLGVLIGALIGGYEVIGGSAGLAFSTGWSWLIA